MGADWIGRREPTGEPGPTTENAQGRRASTLPAARPSSPNSSPDRGDVCEVAE
jgi:hypothetical protein